MLESVSAKGHSFDFCKEELKKSEYSSPVSDICIADLTLLASTADITLEQFEQWAIDRLRSASCASPIHTAC